MSVNPRNFGNPGKLKKIKKTHENLGEFCDNLRKLIKIWKIENNGKNWRKSNGNLKKI